MTGYDVDVLVAGAGPVAMTAAALLARSGVSVRLVDAAAAPATTSRALGSHARSLEIYDQLGILGEIAPHGTRINTFVMHRGGHPNRLDFDFGGLPTRFPYMFNVDQVIIERVLRGQGAAAGVAVEWNTGLESFRQDEDAVTAVLRGPDGTEETVRARYLWGCDGGHSTVRRTLGLPLTGEPAHTWLIADALVHTDVDIDGVHWLFARGGTLMLFPFPEPGKWRLLDTTGEGQPDDPEQIAQAVQRQAVAGPGARHGRRKAQLGVEVHHPAARGSRDAPRAVLRLGGRGPRPLPRLRAGPQHRHPGRVQPGVEAGHGGARPRRHHAARHLRRRARPHRPGPARLHRRGHGHHHGRQGRRHRRHRALSP